MTRSALASILAIAADKYGTGPGFYGALADAALNVLKGPRTGRDLFAALDAAWAAEGLGSRTWEGIPPELRRGYEAVAATFSTPPEPVGWPEGYGGTRWTGSTGPQHTVHVGYGLQLVAIVHGATASEAMERARLTAWAIAQNRVVRVVSQPGEGEPSRQAYIDLQRANATYAFMRDEAYKALNETGARRAGDTLTVGIRRLHEREQELKTAIDGPGGYREQVATLTSNLDAAIAERIGRRA